MKRLYPLLFLLSAVLLVAGCGNDKKAKVAAAADLTPLIAYWEEVARIDFVEAGNPRFDGFPIMVSFVPVGERQLGLSLWGDSHVRGVCTCDLSTWRGTEPFGGEGELTTDLGTPQEAHWEVTVECVPESA